jgi:acyl carrier protein
MADDVVDRTRRVFTSVFGNAVDFAPTLTRLDEARWTSLKHVEFIVALESEFGVRFDGADATDMTSIPAVIDRIEQRLR